MVRMPSLSISCSRTTSAPRSRPRRSWSIASSTCSPNLMLKVTTRRVSAPAAAAAVVVPATAAASSP